MAEAFFVDRSGEAPKKKPRKDTKSLLETQLEEEVFGVGELGGGTGQDNDESQENRDEQVAGTRTAAWVDLDDDKLSVDLRKARLRKLRSTEEEGTVAGNEYGERLREFHRKVVGTQGSWARLRKGKNASSAAADELGADPDSDGEDSPDDAGALEDFKRSTQTVGDHGSTRRNLVSGFLEIRRLRNANASDPCRSVVNTLQFHPSRALLLVGGLDKTLRIFQVDGEENPKRVGVFLKDLPIHTARFTKGGSEIVVAGERKYFYQYDVESSTVQKIATLCNSEERKFPRFVSSDDGQSLAFLGDNGRVFLVSSKSKQKMAFVKMNARVADAAYTNEDRELLTVGGDGNVYRWDLRVNRCISRFHDDGAVRGTVVTSSAKRGLYACGADSGVLNLYGGKFDKPTKSFMNLTTRLDGAGFSSDGALLAYYSTSLKGAFRVVHTASGTVYANWPTESTNLRRVYTSAFSPGNGYLAVGNDKGTVCLFRLLHYPAT